MCTLPLRLSGFPSSWRRVCPSSFFFFFNDTATTEIYTLSLHDALPISYAVVEPHEAPDLAIWHFDFYRFDDPREWEDAGFRDIFASPGLKLAEWPEKAAALTPAADIAIHIDRKSVV